MGKKIHARNFCICSGSRFFDRLNSRHAELTRRCLIGQLSNRIACRCGNGILPASGTRVPLVLINENDAARTILRRNNTETKPLVFPVKNHRRPSLAIQQAIASVADRCRPPAAFAVRSRPHKVDPQNERTR